MSSGLPFNVRMSLIKWGFAACVNIWTVHLNILGPAMSYLLCQDESRNWSTWVKLKAAPMIDDQLLATIRSSHINNWWTKIWKFREGKQKFISCLKVIQLLPRWRLQSRWPPRRLHGGKIHNELRIDISFKSKDIFNMSSKKYNASGFLPNLAQNL